jgi:hypothetical protein
MRRYVRVSLLTSGAVISLVAVGVLILPAPSHWSGAEIVRIRVMVTDAEDHQLIRNARVRLANPSHPSDPTISAKTDIEGWVNLVNEFRASGGNYRLRESRRVSYYRWILEVEAPGYRPFVAPLEPRAQLAQVGGGPAAWSGLSQPVDGSVECVIPMSKVSAEAGQHDEAR